MRRLESGRLVLEGDAAGGARVLKANRGSQGSAVWLCTIAGEGEVTVQYGKDNSTETMTMDELLAKLEQEGEGTEPGFEYLFFSKILVKWEENLVQELGTKKNMCMTYYSNTTPAFRSNHPAPPIRSDIATQNA